VSDQYTDKPLVSIITPVLNGEKFISCAINSVLSQTYPYIEHIVIDGKSEDNTLSIVQESNPKAIVVSEPDNGATDAINKGLRIASGEIIALLNHDDYYAHCNVINKVVDLFVADPQLKVIYGKVRSINPQTEQTLAIYGEPFNYEKMFQQYIIMPYPATFLRKEVCATVGAFSVEYVVCTDYEYYLRVIKLYRPLFLDEILAVMRWGGFSTRNIYRGHREVYKLMRSNGVNPIVASTNLVYKYTMTFLSLALQKIGLDILVRFYRKKKGQL
jgi:glycosyltransferase involved in cell wall biosynthesis